MIVDFLLSPASVIFSKSYYLFCNSSFLFFTLLTTQIQIIIVAITRTDPTVQTIAMTVVLSEKKFIKIYENSLLDIILSKFFSNSNFP